LGNFRQGTTRPVEQEQLGDLRAARVAHNESLFRDANERIASAARRLDLEGVELPFLCECSRATCTEIVRLTLPVFRSLRSSGRTFVCVPAHGRTGGSERIVDEKPGYVVVEKLGRVGEIAERLA